MAEWGRKEYSKKWPSRRPVWAWTTIFLTVVFFFGVFCLDYLQGWTAAERLYLTDYLKSGARGQGGASMQSKYTMLEGVTAKGNPVFLLGDQVERVADGNGKPGYRLTDEGVKAGLVRLEWVTGQYNDRGMHALLGRWVFKHDDIWGYMARPFYWSLAFFVLFLFVAVPRDRKRRMVWKHGRRLRGPELVTTSELNEKLGKSKLLKTILPDRIMFINEEQTWWDKIAHKDLSRWARIPRDREAMHFLIVGNEGPIIHGNGDKSRVSHHSPCPR